MERYWCLRWLGQEGVKMVDAVVLKDELVRLTDVPLVVRLPGMSQVARGAQVKLDIVRWDEIELNLEARLLEVASSTPDAAIADEEDTEADTDTGEAAAAEAVEAEGAVAVVETADVTEPASSATPSSTSAP
jgi:exoribonuclease-2